MDKEITVVFSGNGEESCLAVDSATYDAINMDNTGMIDDYYPRIKKLVTNKFVKLKNGDRLFNISVSELCRLFPQESKHLKGYKAKITLEPITADEIDEGWFD
ncbi:MAG: hypothetical protein ACP5M6_03780 [Methanobrevibacter sp.]